MRDIKSFAFEELRKEISSIKEPAYRASQIFSWIYKKGVKSFEEMDNIPRALKDKLSKDYYISSIELSEHLRSRDGTEKFLFKLEDSNFIESVIIYAKERETLCISTQVGCKFACKFCASGQMGFTRNLTAPEIINQILYILHDLKHKITNYVFMGMGEPLDNYENLIKVVMIMNDPEGMDIGARRITISTCGIVPGIEKLKEVRLQINLSVSLHAANDRIRGQIMPINKKYPLEKLIKACQDYIGKRKRKITLEYILIKDKNDSLTDADGLAKISRKLDAKVNLIPFSEIQGVDFKSPSKEDTDRFMDMLIDKKVNVTLRESKGKDIQAACGQLAGKQKVI